MLENSATHDPLTSISNRRLFKTNLDEAINRAKLNKSMIGLFYLDLDHFKLVNDTYGHDAGDFVLKNVIYKLSVFFRKEDILSRIGGDEFAIIIENAKNKNELKSIAIKICELIDVPIKMNNSTLNVAVSIGISTYPDDGNTMDELVNCADQRMFYAKKHGGNQFSFKSDD
jgi:diguanylate cyclase (GGDEF)-like protein